MKNGIARKLRMLFLNNYKKPVTLILNECMANQIISILIPNSQ